MRAKYGPHRDLAEEYRKQLEICQKAWAEATARAISAYGDDPAKVWDSGWPDWLKLLASLRVVDFQPPSDAEVERGQQIAKEQGYKSNGS